MHGLNRAVRAVLSLILVSLSRRFLLYVPSFLRCNLSFRKFVAVPLNIYVQTTYSNNSFVNYKIISRANLSYNIENNEIYMYTRKISVHFEKNAIGIVLVYTRNTGCALRSLYTTPKQETLFPNVPSPRHISVNLSSFLPPDFCILHALFAHLSIPPLVRPFLNFRLDGRTDYAEP